MKLLQHGLLVFLLAGCTLLPGNTYAQFVEITTNQSGEKPKDTVITPEDISKLFGEHPDQYYNRYLDTLVETKKYKAAEKIVQDRIKAQKRSGSVDPLPFIDLGYLLDKEDKGPKAKEQYDKALQMVNGDDILTRRLAGAFMDYGNLEYATRVYEIATGILKNPYFYGGQLADLYAKTGHLDKAIDLVLANNPMQGNNVEAIKTLLLQILGNDRDKLKDVQKIIIQKLNEQPDNPYLEEILTWIYTQKNDWDGALMQMEAIDERNREQGRRLLDFARNALNEKQYEIADKAFNDVIAKGADMPLYLTAKSEQLSAGYNRLKNDPNDTIAGVADSLVKRYDNFLKENPGFNPGQVASDYAEVEALYIGNTGKAIGILEKVVYRNDLRREQVGKLKLQMGDYYLLEGKIWDASLTYSQVDKEFKQDAMGEDARFRNAKLAYYRGDFDWAQRQLMILKSATSELISNDAIALSVLITENVEDSVTYPLQRFAHADLLLAQNKDKEGLELMDSIAKAFPKHPLNDDILMRHALTEEKHHNFQKALTYLEQIHKQYGDDVLGDDAVFKMAEICQNDLHDNSKAKEYYEQLIIEYPGSTFVQAARQRLHDINNPVAP